MQVYHPVNAFISILDVNPVPDGAEIIADMENSCGLDAG